MNSDSSQADDRLRELISQLPKDDDLEQPGHSDLNDYVFERRPLPYRPPDPGGMTGLLNVYLRRVSDMLRNQSELASVPEFQAVQAAAANDPAGAILFILEDYTAAVMSIAASYQTDVWERSLSQQGLLVPLVRKKQKFSATQVETLIDLMVSLAPCELYDLPWGSLVKQIEHFASASSLSDGLREKIQALSDAFKQPSVRKFQARLQAVILTTISSDQEADDTVPLFAFRTNEPWIVVLQEGVAADGDKANRIRCSAWQKLIEHLASASNAKPSKKWLKAAAELISEIGPEQYSHVVAESLKSVGQPAPESEIRTYEDSNYSHPLDPTVPHNIHSDLLRGLCWSLGSCPQLPLIEAVGQCGEVCYAKIPGYGPRAAKIGNACVNGLSESGTPQGIARLSRLHETVRHASSKKQIGKALERAAAAAGISRIDLEEMSVPDCGFTSIGELRQQVGEYTAIVSINRRLKAELGWLKPDGKPQKTVPKDVKADHAAAVKKLKAAAKAAEQILSVWRSRVESFPLVARDLPFRTFQGRYINHPLLGVLARRLIWTADTSNNALVGRADSNGLLTADGTVHHPGEDAGVSLWHPINATGEEIVAWRESLLRAEVTQPFKQVHREVYRLTDAERDTGTYSNRFARHVLKQHQLKALCDARLWSYTIQGKWDGDGETPRRVLDEWNLSAEFQIEPVVYEMGDTGVWLYMTTDQVRFVDPVSEESVSLEDVPALPFSEIMRDVDLFVGVASIGADPAWTRETTETTETQTETPEQRARIQLAAYWDGFSRGALTATGETRRQVLELLIPRLKIADQCEVDGRFLRVKGKKRVYRIHLGSGNIIMEHNNEYLCIVPGASRAADNVVLPFEGDYMLSIVLSKAFLLADDHKIKDATILSQID